MNRRLRFAWIFARSEYHMPLSTSALVATVFGLLWCSFVNSWVLIMFPYSSMNPEDALVLMHYSKGLKLCSGGMMLWLLVDFLGSFWVAYSRPRQRKGLLLFAIFLQWMIYYSALQMEALAQ
ncbi:MAG: hypothetical protein GY747_07180 [Planctomycetes bacterium]|nr:hypothetical protein [Planctomycetota bacterium]MCP4771897.1 hypothetical protein [Planctomycetota bacterium]MCP4861941.1 hypothetical protein [Planctomycetota bacterium]